MKKLFRPCILALWLSTFFMVAFASCKTNNVTEQPTIERITERGTLRELHENYGLVYAY